MFRRKTLFIVGAGASCEAGLPVGSVLKEQIAESLGSGPGLDLDSTLSNAFSMLGNSNGEGLYYNAAALIRRNMSQAISIDNFLDAHQENKYVNAVGKLLIVYALLRAEKVSKLTSKIGEIRLLILRSRQDPKILGRDDAEVV